MLFNDFEYEIQKYSMIKEGETVIAAVSGGADSVCLLHLLYRLRKTLPFTLICAHVNHGIREEASLESSHVEKLCYDWNIPFHLYKANVLEISKERKISVELAGREERYAFFKSLSANKIFTAHTKNDVAESVLLHLIRGCGIEGLCGIKKVREDNVMRPLTIFTRTQIEEYLQAHALSFCTDTSNFDLVYTRNRIRHKLLPEILNINPSFIDTIENFTDILFEENEYINSILKNNSYFSEEDDCIRLHLDFFSCLHIALKRRVLRKVASSFRDIEGILNLCNAQNGARYSLPDGKVAEKEYGYITIYKPIAKTLESIPLPKSGEIIFQGYKIIIGDEGFSLSDNVYYVRTRKDGDYFYPEGMQGKQKVKEYFINNKIPKRLRDTIPIIVCGEDIAAVSNLRRDRRFVSNDENCIRIKIQKLKHV